MSMMPVWMLLLIAAVAVGVPLAATVFPTMKVYEGLPGMLGIGIAAAVLAMASKFHSFEITKSGIKFVTRSDAAPKVASDEAVPAASKPPAQPRGHAEPPDLVDGYLDRVMKLVPMETIALYLILDAQLTSVRFSVPGWPVLTVPMLLFAACLVLTFVYVRVRANTAQAVISTLGFVCWMYAIGGPFKELGSYSQTIGALLLMVFMTVAPMYRGRAD